MRYNMIIIIIKTLFQNIRNGSHHFGPLALCKVTFQSVLKHKGLTGGHYIMALCPKWCALFLYWLTSVLVGTSHKGYEIHTSALSLSTSGIQVWCMNLL